MIMNTTYKIHGDGSNIFAQYPQFILDNDIKIRSNSSMAGSGREVFSMSAAIGGNSYTCMDNKMYQNNNNKIIHALKVPSNGELVVSFSDIVISVVPTDSSSRMTLSIGLSGLIGDYSSTTNLPSKYYSYPQKTVASGTQLYEYDPYTFRINYDDFTCDWFCISLTITVYAAYATHVSGKISCFVES